ILWIQFSINMLHGSRFKSMPAILRSDDARIVFLLPVSYCREIDLIIYAEHKDFPIIPCNLCGSQENLQRESIKAML
ncbi:tRNA 2-thiocytidine(32) synthetase TtcA, partial [Pseudoalteromonas sp. S4389]